MVFSTLTFLYVFFPVCLGLYFLMPTLRAKNIALLLMSLVFYAWGDPVCVLLMMFTAFANYFCGLRIASAKDQTVQKRWLAVSVVASLAFLVFFKYTGFFLSNLNRIPGVRLPGFQIALPIGISFYTFQAMSYTIDVYRGEANVQRSYADFLLYVSLFPQLIAGPIVRYVDVQNEIVRRKTTAEDFVVGITRFAVGLAKKLLLANYCGSAADKLLKGTDASVLGGWLGLILFAFQIYFDFSGYSDMAIGLGRMLGFHFKENFDYPYICSSITDFWRRWHISLSSWIRDYVYISLGGNRKGDLRTCFNIFFTMLLAGLWHGASWNFVIWGALFGLAQVVHRTFRVNILHHDRHYRSQGVKRFFAVLSTFVFVLFTFMVFRNSDMQGVVDMLTQMFTKFHPEVAVQCVTGYVWVFVLVVFGFVSHWLPQAWESRMVAYLSKCNLLVYVLLLTGVIFLICQVKTSDVQPFIYFQF